MNQKHIDITYLPASSLSSLRIGTGTVRHISVTRPEDLELLHNLYRSGEILHISGKGTNTTYGQFGGVVVTIDIHGHEWICSNTLKIGAGEEWQLAVDLSLKKNLTGIERLTQIPGTVGAAPVQNIGAFGQVLSDRLKSVDVYDYRTNEHLTIPATDCGFGNHRASNFKNKNAWRSYVITGIAIDLLDDNNFKPPTGEGLIRYSAEHNLPITSATESERLIREFRTILYPDYKLVPNCGSYFTNYEIDNISAKNLPASIWEVKHRDARNGTATLFQCKDLLSSVGIAPGFKFTGGLMMHSDFNNFLVNTGNATVQDLLDCHTEVNRRLGEKYGIMLVPEPEFVDDTTKHQVR